MPRIMTSSLCHLQRKRGRVFPRDPLEQKVDYRHLKFTIKIIKHREVSTFCMKNIITSNKINV
jgi:hypothetical protein